MSTIVPGQESTHNPESMSSFPDEHDVQNPLIESQEEQFEAIQTNTPPTVCKEYPASHPEHIIWNQEVSEKEQTVQ